MMRGLGPRDPRRMGIVDHQGLEVSVSLRAGSRCRTWDWGNQDGGPVTKSVLWVLFTSLALILARSFSTLSRWTCPSI